MHSDTKKNHSFWRMVGVLVLRYRKESLDLYKGEPFSGILSYLDPDPNKICLLSPFLTDTYLKDQSHQCYYQYDVLLAGTG